MKELREDLKIGDVVRHFKRETIKDKASAKYIYKIIGVATHTETKEDLVIYKALYSDENIEFGKIFARAFDMFISEVDREKYPNIKQKYRLERATAEDISAVEVLYGPIE